MFDNNDINEFDRMMKSILDEGTEEVPAGVWDKVSEDLDKAAQHKTVVLWWKRAAAGTAVAAAIAAGVIFNHPSDEMILPAADGDEMVAVVEKPAVEEEEAIEEVEIVVPDLVAQSRRSTVPADEDMVIKTAGEAMEAVSDAGPAVIEEKSGPVAEEAKPEETRAEEVRTEEYLPMEWGEEEKADKKRVSLVFSGIAATNDEQSKNRIGPMKAPTLAPAPEKTGITETSTRSTYGIPVSFGAGVKIDLTDRWAIGVGANYTLLTRKFYGKYTEINKDGGIANSTSSDIRNSQHFVGIPVNAYYNIVNKDRINLYAYAGGTAEKCVSDKYNLINTDIHHTGKVKGIQLSANVGFGVEFMLGKHLGLYLDPSLRYYFDCGQPKSIRTVQPLMLGFEMGFRARL